MVYRGFCLWVWRNPGFCCFNTGKRVGIKLNEKWPYAAHRVNFLRNSWYVIICTWYAMICHNMSWYQICRYVCHDMSWHNNDIKNFVGPIFGFLRETIFCQNQPQSHIWHFWWWNPTESNGRGNKAMIIPLDFTVNLRVGRSGDRPPDTFSWCRNAPLDTYENSASVRKNQMLLHRNGSFKDGWVHCK